MPHRVIWSDEALADVEAVRRYLFPLDPRAALRLRDRILEAGERLSDFPNRGRSLGGNLRQLSLIYPYLIRYVVEDNRVTIASVRHGAREEEGPG